MKQKEVDEWTKEDVRKWALEQVDVEERDAAILFQENVTGKNLLTLTEEKLRRLGMRYAPAASLEAAIEALKPISSTSTLNSMNYFVDLLQPLKISKKCSLLATSRFSFPAM